uniref:Uncharacterized protein n=1 Tax=Raoultella ornithinolytica TaxID=54291 RepID=A0A7G9A761_RAOOR|nr:Hypothetical protein [Raoultella ornithinolytica]UFD96715.1 hypothetical protein [Klebsiella oxytoca]
MACLNITNAELKKIRIATMFCLDCDIYGPPNGGLILTL